MIGKIKISKRQNIWMYLLGIFSTLQVFSLFGVTIFNWLLIINVIVLFLSSKKVKKAEVKYIAPLLLSLIFTTFFSLVLKRMSDEYIRKTIISFIVLVMILFIFVVILSDNKKNKIIQDFFSGFELSCKINIYWCFLQMILYWLAGIDINYLIFNQTLKLIDLPSYIREGSLVCTGLSWHQATLMPILTYIYIKSYQPIEKVMCLIIAMLSKGATNEIALFLCLAIDIIKYFKVVLKGRLKKKYILFFISILLAGTIGIFVLWDEIYSNLLYLFRRIIDITSTEGGNSSATHFSYYTRLPIIMKQSHFIQILFGYGISCSGFAFSTIFFQYVNQVWVVESDIVNILISQGLVGFSIFYGFLIYIAVKVYKNNPKITIFFIITLVSGIAYNVQFDWTILLELMMFAAFLKEINILED